MFRAAAMKRARGERGAPSVDEPLVDEDEREWLGGGAMADGGSISLKLRDGVGVFDFDVRGAGAPGSKIRSFSLNEGHPGE